MQYCRAKICKQIQHSPYTEQTLFRPLPAGERVILRTSYSPQNHRIRIGNKLARCLWKWLASGFYRASAQQTRFQFKLQPVTSQRLKNAYRLSNDFRADTVAGDGGDAGQQLAVEQEVLAECLGRGQPVAGDDLAQGRECGHLRRGRGGAGRRSRPCG